MLVHGNSQWWQQNKPIIPLVLSAGAIYSVACEGLVEGLFGIRLQGWKAWSTILLIDAESGAAMASGPPEKAWDKTSQEGRRSAGSD